MKRARESERGERRWRYAAQPWEPTAATERTSIFLPPPSAGFFAFSLLLDRFVHSIPVSLSVEHGTSRGCFSSFSSFRFLFCVYVCVYVHIYTRCCLLCSISLPPFSFSHSQRYLTVHFFPFIVFLSSSSSSFLFQTKCTYALRVHLYIYLLIFICV